MVSAKQVGRRRPTFWPQTRWNRGVLSLQMGENLLNDHRVVDAGDDPHRPAAFPAGLDIDIEHPLETLRPAHRCPSLGGSLFLARLGRFGFVPPPPPGRGHQRAVFAVRCKYPMKACLCGDRDYAHRGRSVDVEVDGGEGVARVTALQNGA